MKESPMMLSDVRADSSRTILVTGGTGALGNAVTKRLLDDGHRVVSTFVVKEEAEALREAVGRTERLLLVETDATDPTSVSNTIEDVQEEIGPVEALVHLVGAWKGGTAVHDQPLQDWDRMFDLNLRSALLCCRAVLPSMREARWGRIVLVSSRSAREGRSGQVAYATAKAGVAVLAETIAEENRGLDSRHACEPVDDAAGRFQRMGAARGRGREHLFPYIAGSGPASRRLAACLRVGLTRRGQAPRLQGAR